MRLPRKKCRPTLAIIDRSAGPSGLSKYLEMLWPALTDHFETYVFGLARGPLRDFPNAQFVPVLGYSPQSESKNQVQDESIVLRRLSNRKIGTRMMRSLWRGLTPTSIRYLAGFTKDIFRLYPTLKRYPIDIAYVPVCGAETAVLAARLAGIRSVVGTLHMPPRTSSSLHRRMSRLVFRSLKSAIAVSGTTAQAWIELVPTQAGKVAIIPNGIQVVDLASRQTSRSETMGTFGLPTDGRPIFIGVGRLAPQKGFGFLLEAVALLKNTYPTLTVAIAGNGPLAGELSNTAERLNIKDNVYFLGQLPDVSPLLAHADGFVLSSISEAMPFALLEAMSHGLPVVATAVGGVPEAVRDGETGILCPPQDPKCLAAGIERLLQSHELAKRLGQAGNAEVQKSYSVETMRRATLEVFQRAVET
jgi:glycosyltransferase involved in cell wall biosynthesis